MKIITKHLENLNESHISVYECTTLVGYEYMCLPNYITSEIELSP